MNTKQRSVVLYITIDPYDHRDENGHLRGHETNLARVREAAESWRAGTTVLDRWCSHVTGESLTDPSLLALFLSGSYTEWVESFRQPAWSEILDRFCDLIRATNVPILAVCGSHQLVARAYGGWQSVGHMAPSGSAPIAIADEADTVIRAPNPRLGEVGTFRYRLETQDLAQRRNDAKIMGEIGTFQYNTEISDPLFDELAGAPDAPLIFSQWHYDEVIHSALPACATSLLRPEGLAGCVQNRELGQLRSVVVTSGAEAAAYTHRPIEDASECCRVQALRYDVPPEGRVLYTTQFHPDLGGADSAGSRDHGIALIHNFLRLADAY